MGERKKPQDVYASLFDLVFKTQKLKKSRDKKPEKVRDNNLQDGLEEIISEPVLYPVDTVISDLLRQIDQSTQVFESKLIKDGKYAGDFKTKGFKFGFGLTSGFKFLSDPIGNIQYSFDKYKQDRKWAGIGGFTNNTMNSALFSIMARKLGFSSEISRVIGSSFLLPDISEYDKDGVFQKRLFLDKYSSVISELVIQDLKKMFKDKKLDEGSIRKEVKEIIIKLEKEDKAEGVKSRLSVLLDELGTNKEIAATVKNLTFGEDDSDNKGVFEKDEFRLYSNYKAAALNLLSLRAADKLPREYKKIMRVLTGLSGGEDRTSGVRVGKLLFTARWLKEGVFDREFLDAIISGDYEALRLGSFKFRDVVDKDGLPTGVKESVFVENSSAIGKLVGSTYYLHPWNLFKGVLVDGGFWLKLSTKRKKVDGSSFYYKLYQLSIGQQFKRHFSGVSKFVNNAFSKIATTFFGKNWAFMIRQTVTKVLSRIFASTIPGIGVIVTILSGLISDQIVKILSEVVIVIVVGLFALIGLLFYNISSSFSPGVYQYDYYSNQYNSNIEFFDTKKSIENNSYEDFESEYEKNSEFLGILPEIQGKDLEDFEERLSTEIEFIEILKNIDSKGYEEYASEYESNSEFIHLSPDEDYEYYEQEYENNSEFSRVKKDLPDLSEFLDTK